MFYSTDILSHRKTGLGIVWLAATLGDRSVVRRLSRREILSVNITSTCESIRLPIEPLALRLSSQLLYGVVKLYRHQTELLYQDVGNVHSDVRRRRLLAVSTGLTETEDIDMRKATKGVEAITLPVDLAFFALDFDALTSRVWASRWSVEPVEWRRTWETGLGLGEESRMPTPGSGSELFVAGEEHITLPGRAFDEELGLPRGYDEGGEIGPVFGGEGYDEEDFEGLDLGLEGGEPSGRPEPFTPGAPEDIHRRHLGDDTATTGPLVEWPELEERLAEEAARMEIGPIIGGIPTVTPTRRPRDEQEAAEMGGLLTRALQRRRPATLPLEDLNTELSDHQLRSARANYVERMAAERATQDRRRQARQDGATARQMMFGPPEDLALNPMLSGMWTMTVGAQLLARGARLRQMRDEARMLPMGDSPPTPPPPTPMEEEEVAEVGVARATAGGREGGAAELEIPAALRGARESLPWNVFAEHRRRSSMMPSVSYDRPTLERDTTPLRIRDISVETPTGLRRLPAPASPLFPALASPSTVAPLEESYQVPLPDTPSVERFRLGLPIAAAPQSPTPPSRVLEEDVEEETRNFYQYARSIRQELKDPNFLFFSDLAPVASSTPAVAAQAFYHTLALASRGALRVHQDAPYHEIRISLIAP